MTFGGGVYGVFSTSAFFITLSANMPRAVRFFSTHVSFWDCLGCCHSLSCFGKISVAFPLNEIMKLRHRGISQTYPYEIVFLPRLKASAGNISPRSTSPYEHGGDVWSPGPSGELLALGTHAHSLGLCRV